MYYCFTEFRFARFWGRNRPIHTVYPSSSPSDAFRFEACWLRFKFRSVLETFGCVCDVCTIFEYYECLSRSFLIFNQIICGPCAVMISKTIWRVSNYKSQLEGSVKRRMEGRRINEGPHKFVKFWSKTVSEFSYSLMFKIIS